MSNFQYLLYMDYLNWCFIFFIGLLYLANQTSCMFFLDQRPPYGDHFYARSTEEIIRI